MNPAMNLKTLFITLLLCPALSGAQETKGSAETDPAPAKAAASTGPAQVKVDLDWIAMPLEEANRLLKEKLQSATSHKDLRAAVEEMLAKKTAHRVDSATLTVPDGKSTKTESLTTKPCPVDWRIDAIAENTYKLKTGTTTLRNIGRTVEVEATVSSDNQHIVLYVSTGHDAVLGELLWKAGDDNIAQPVFTSMMTHARSRVKSGEWNCEGVFRLWTMPAEPLKTDREPPSAERVMLFARATVDTARPPAPAETGLPGCLLFCEWIEADSDAAAALVTKHGSMRGGEAIREAIQKEIAAGKATLMETSVVPVMEKWFSKTESFREHPCPITMNLEAARASGRARLAAAKGTPSALATGEGQEAPISFEARSIGVSMEAEVFREEPGEWEVNIASELSYLSPRDSNFPAPRNAPPPSSAPSAPRIQQFNMSSMQAFVAGKTSMAATMRSRGTFNRGDWGGRGRGRGRGEGGGRGEGSNRGEGEGRDRGPNNADSPKPGSDSGNANPGQNNAAPDNKDQNGKDDAGEKKSSSDNKDQSNNNAGQNNATPGNDTPRDGNRGTGGFPRRPRRSVLLFVKVLE